MKYAICLICSLLFITLPAKPSFGHKDFAKAIKAKHSLKKVSCYACHVRKAIVPPPRLPAFMKNKKAFRNDFGQQFAKLLKGKNVTKRILAAKAAAKESPDDAKIKAELAKVKAAIIKEFLEALTEVEKLKSPAGPTYGTLLKKGPLNGVNGVKQPSPPAAGG